MIPTFVNVSGGRTSGYMAHMLRDKPDHIFLFQNTGRERPETYDFLHKMELEWKLPIIWLEYSCPDPLEAAIYKIVNYEIANRDGLPFSQLNDKRKAIPNKFKRFCSSELKVKTARRYIRAQGILRWNYAIGFRADENRQTHSDNMQTVVTPLKDSNINIRDVGEFWKNNSFDLKLPMMPNGKTFGGNCMGCFWHSEYQNAHLCRNNPEQVKWLIAEEEKHGHTFNENFSFKQLTQWTKDAPQMVFDIDDALCTATNGSCGI